MQEWLKDSDTLLPPCDWPGKMSGLLPSNPGWGDHTPLPLALFVLTLDTPWVPATTARRPLLWPPLLRMEAVLSSRAAVSQQDQTLEQDSLAPIPACKQMGGQAISALCTHLHTCKVCVEIKPVVMTRPASRWWGGRDEVDTQHLECSRWAA